MFGQISVENDEDPWAQISSQNNFQSFPQAIQVLFRYVAPLSVTCHADLSRLVPPGIPAAWTGLKTLSTANFRPMFGL